ncbi:hypothetical protein JOD24_001424 [Kroppenstedtia sanguinis]|uniref:hypothetical protein n=1 Tax=Kroppenstedtia sanguinis TaxID=1380684 RepID=UPI003D2038A0
MNQQEDIATKESLIGRRSTRLGTGHQSEEEVIHLNILKQLLQGQATVIKRVPELMVDKTLLRLVAEVVLSTLYEEKENHRSGDGIGDWMNGELETFPGKFAEI